MIRTDGLSTAEPTQRVAVWCAGEELSPITTTATVIGKKWHTVVRHRLPVDGPLGFNALRDDGDGVSSEVLSDVLDDFEEKQLLEREIVQENQSASSTP